MRYIQKKHHFFATPGYDQADKETYTSIEGPGLF